MNFEQLLQACTNGLPEVKIEKPVSGATSATGKVIVLKDNGRFKGCAVLFPGLPYDLWFNDEPEGTDKRKHYMHELSFL
jgi:hypothetical protein